MKNIFVLGAGRSSTTLIKYLLKEKGSFNITIGEKETKIAEQKFPLAKIVSFDILDTARARSQLKKADLDALANQKLATFSNSLSEKALRYDLTVPFARYVVQHQNDISFPFKRYQIQPVWRADRPQHGRFQEFFQCDADIVGSKSLWQEVELCGLYDDVFYRLQLNGVLLKINNRKILSGIAEVLGASERIIDFTVALDKLDKIGQEGVINELL